MSLLPDVDVFISNYTLVDPEVYQLWVDGCSSAEAVTTLEQRGIIQQTGATLDLVKSDIQDHYRTYSLLERLLHTPPKLSEQLAFQIEPQTKRLLIEKYYELDDVVIRELLGKKLSSRHRKDLDEVSEKTSVKLKSCQRQFDNVKRIFKVVEELQGSIMSNIKSNFLLPDELAKRYGAVIFIACIRFETSKRKVQYLTFPDIFHCSQAIMATWTYGAGTPDYDDTDVDREFLADLKDLRVLLDKEKEHKHLVCNKLRPQMLERTYQDVETSFRTYTRSLVGLACNLHQNRSLRSLFVELFERCVEPWRQVTWTHADVKNFLAAYSQSALEMDVLREADLKRGWERYMKVITKCLLRMYHT